jgi:hypothetical protein
MSLPFIPKNWQQLEELLIDFSRRIDNLEGVRGNKLSHKNLKDIDDHKFFMTTEKSTVTVGSLLEESSATTTAGLKNDLNEVIKSINDLKNRLKTVNIKAT